MVKSVSLPPNQSPSFPLVVGPPPENRAALSTWADAQADHVETLSPTGGLIVFGEVIRQAGQFANKFCIEPQDDIFLERWERKRPTRTGTVAPWLRELAVYCKGRKSAGGRKPSRDELWKMIQTADAEIPKPIDQVIAGRYNKRFGKSIDAGSRKKATASIVATLRYDRKKRNRRQKHN